MHLIVEAHDQRALSRRMQGLQIRLAKNFNRVMNRRRGRVFADRYHARALKTPLEVRRVLAYVMGNASRHFANRAAAPPASRAVRWRARPVADPFTSAEFFEGWRDPVEFVHSMCSLERPPVSPPATWLLRTGWKRHGLLVAE